MTRLRNTPGNEIFITTTGDEPADWPDHFRPGDFVKVVAYNEGMWTEVEEDTGTEILATMANTHTEGRLHFGEPVAYLRENVRNWMPART
ncbi:hypothetical protein [Arthrobacter sp. A2-55]|uniref:hypothetical protein n=1 Tax=Arthrobacter sp. A2-55 TaxID=2897337 RepID=UPI0021CD9E55|nr:hypothetical protein [Arthrobacter sp. A2-55]MCU6479077.1 hypothetical protein [Arthrobacter sp. A2-55]